MVPKVVQAAPVDAAVVPKVVPMAPAGAVVDGLSDSDGPRKLLSWRYSPSRCEAAMCARAYHSTVRVVKSEGGVERPATSRSGSFDFG